MAISLELGLLLFDFISFMVVVKIYAGAMSIDQLLANKFSTAYLPISAFKFNRFGADSTSGVQLIGISTDDPGCTHALSDEISSRIGAFMLPVQPYGAYIAQNNCCTDGDTGDNNLGNNNLGNNNDYSIGVDPGLLYDMTLDLARCLRGQGFRRLVLHKGHPGLTMLYPLTRHLNAAEGVKTVLVDPGALVSAAHGGSQSITDDRKTGGSIFSEAVRLSVEYIFEAFAFMDSNGAYAPMQA